MVDFGRHSSMAGLVERLEYDPNRTGYIALVRYPAGEAAYKDYYPLSYLCACSTCSGTQHCCLKMHVEVMPFTAYSLRYPSSSNISVAGLVERLEYDPDRSGYIALVRYPAGKAATRASLRLRECVHPTAHHCLECMKQVVEKHSRQFLAASSSHSSMAGLVERLAYDPNRTRLHRASALPHR
jgi:ribosomal protein L2